MIVLGGFAVTLVTYGLTHSFATTPLGKVLFATDPFSRSLNYTVGTLGVIDRRVRLDLDDHRASAGAPASPGAWRPPGRMTLTIYVLHALVFNLLVHVLGWIRPTGLDTAVLFTIVFWVTSIVLAAWWQRHLGLGPMERFYRRFGGNDDAGTGSAERSQIETPISANVPSH